MPSPRALPRARPYRAIALIRVSKEKDGGTSPEIQRHAIESFAARERITIVEYVEGIDESGSRAKSAWWPKLNAAIERLESGDVDTIIVWRFSRIARNRMRWAVALDRVDVANGFLLSATEPNDRSAAGDLQRGMYGEINLYQAKLIGEGWLETHERRIREGKPATGRPRFGYIRDSAADTYTIDPVQATIVRDMYERAVAGQGMAAITRWLNGTGQRTRQGNEWQTIGVRRYLDRGFAAGLIWVHGEHHPGAHEAIISDELWAAYLSRRASTTRPPRGSVRMLSGILKCGTCGGPMMATGSGGVGHAYTCAARARGGSCDSPAFVSRAVAEAFVEAWLGQLQESVERLRAADEREAARRLATIEDRGAISRVIRRTEERLSTLTLMLVDGKISQSAYEAAAGELDGELTALRLRFSRTAPRPASNYLERVPKLIEGWSMLDPKAQNDVVRTLIDRVTVQRGRGEGRLAIVPRWETRN